MKILVIQQKMIGDVLATSVLFGALRKKYPNAVLHYLINAHTLPVVLGNQHIDKFVVVTQKIEDSLIRLYQFCRSIRSEDYDIIIDCYGKLSSNLITKFSRAKTKISFYKSYTSYLYTDTILRKKNVSVIDNRLELLKPLKIEAKKLKPQIFLFPQELERAKAVLRANNIDFKKPLFMMSILGSSEEKTYPLAYMAVLIETVVDITDANILFNYIPNQIDKVHKLYNLCNEKTKKHILLDIYGSDLREFLALTNYCNAMIGNEGGAINMAKALEIPTFAIFCPWIDKEGWNFLEDGKRHVSVHLKDVRPALYHHVDLKKNTKMSMELYQKFEPALILPSLKNFLSANRTVKN